MSLRGAGAASALQPILALLMVPPSLVADGFTLKPSVLHHFDGTMTRTQLFLAQCSMVPVAGRTSRRRRALFHLKATQFGTFPILAVTGNGRRLLPPRIRRSKRPPRTSTYR